MTLRPLVFLQRQRPVMKRITRFALTVVLGFTAQLTQANQLEDNLHKFSEGSKSYQAGDYKTAVDIWRTQALLGFVMAQTMLGFVYAEGTGVTQDYQESAKWHQMAADHGSPFSQNALGSAYVDGNGVPQSYEEAVKLFRKAADSGHADAQYNLGLLYYKGRGVTQNYQESAKWFRKAAVLGQAGAQHNLGVAYAHGRGIPQSNVLAYMLFNIAATNGNIDSVQHRHVLLNQMTPTEIAKGQALAAKWKLGTPLPKSH